MVPLSDERGMRHGSGARTTDGHDTRRVALVDAFATDPLCGAATGVVPDAAGLDDDETRAVARELGADVTAFVRPADGATRRLRCVTPHGDRPDRGRAVLAAVAHLRAAGAVEAGTHEFETDAGREAIRVDDDGTVWLTRPTPTVDTAALDFDRVGAALGIVPDALRDVGADLPGGVAVVGDASPGARAGDAAAGVGDAAGDVVTGAGAGDAAGASILVVPVNFLERLGEAAPDPGALDRLAAAHEVDGVYAVTFDAVDAASTLHGRYFVPGRDPPERPASVPASVACAAYLRTVDAFDEFPDALRFEGGHFLDRPGAVELRVDGTIRVGGRATTALDGELRVPTTDDDEIIEA